MENYLTFSSPNTFTLNVIDNTKYWNGTLEYSTDTQTWNEWSGTSAISSSADGKLYMRGTGNNYITGSSANSSKACWVLTGNNISCSGNIENLLDYQTVANNEHPVMAIYCYYSMFYGCTNLTTAPELPATTLAERCYKAMFYGCTNIKLSTTQTDEYQKAYRIPTSETGTTATNALTNMFTNTGGTFTGTPEINTTYYIKVISKSSITYNNTTTTIHDGQTAILKCKGKRMLSDVTVNGKCNIIYNYVVTEIEEGQTATLKCNNKKMLSDVEIEK